MKYTKGPEGGRTLLVLSAVLLLLSACGEPEETPPMEMDMDMPMEMEMDPAMMERHADEADGMAAEVREHVDAFRRLSPEEQHARFAEHAGVVAGMLGLMDRQMREMSMGMPMDDEEMGAMMGMSGEEHRQMMQQMATLRTEAEDLQVAPTEEIGARMGAHLDRLEAMARMLETMAREMRTM
jgi:hypothetical protein